MPTIIFENLFGLSHIVNNISILILYETVDRVDVISGIYNLKLLPQEKKIFHVLEKNAKLDKKGSFSSFLLLPLKKLIYASYGCIGFIDKPLG